MNILILSPKAPYPPIDGGAIATLTLARNLRKAGNNITFLSLNTSKHFTDINNIPEEIITELDLQLINIDTKINPAKALLNLLFSKKPYNIERFLINGFAKKLIEVLGSKDFGIIQLEGLSMLPYLKIIRQNTCAKVVLRAHNVEHIIWKRNYSFERNIIRKLYYRLLYKRILRLEKSMLNKLDACIPITQHDKEIFENLGIKVPMHVACAGIDNEKINTGQKQINYSSLFFIGALDWIPNQEGLKWFIDNVWPIVHKRLPNQVFHVGGRNAPEWIIKYCNKPGIMFHGEVDSAERFMLTNGIMAVPLFAGSGMRIKIIEGMALGVSIITSTIGIEGINAKDDKAVLIADTADNFIEKICFVLENTDICKKIGQNAILYIKENYDNLNIARELTGFYKSITK